jgi:hypothetical protein
MSLYPKVDASMSDPEKAMAYQHNKTAFASADLDKCACIFVLAAKPMHYLCSRCKGCLIFMGV